MGAGGSRLCQRLEIDMRGQIGKARLCQRIGIGVIAQGLKRIACQVPVTVVDDQGGPAMPCDAGRDLSHDRRRCGAYLHDIARRGIGEAVVQKRDRRWCRQRDRKPCAISRDHGFAPACRIAGELPDRQRIKELVRQKKERQVGQLGGMIHPRGRCGA